MKKIAKHKECLNLSEITKTINDYERRDRAWSICMMVSGIVFFYVLVGLDYFIIDFFASNGYSVVIPLLLYYGPLFLATLSLFKGVLTFERGEEWAGEWLGILKERNLPAEDLWEEDDDDDFEWED